MNYERAKELFDCWHYFPENTGVCKFCRCTAIEREEFLAAIQLCAPPKMMTGPSPTRKHSVQCTCMACQAKAAQIQPSYVTFPQSAPLTAEEFERRQQEQLAKLKEQGIIEKIRGKLLQDESYSLEEANAEIKNTIGKIIPIHYVGLDDDCAEINELSRKKLESYCKCKTLLNGHEFGCPMEKK